MFSARARCVNGHTIFADHAKTLPCRNFAGVVKIVKESDCNFTE
jgi:hypothetical protein